MSSQSPYSSDPIQPPIPRPSGNNSTWIIVAIFVVGLPMLLICAGVIVALLLPAMQAARASARRMASSNNMKQIALALHNYESVYGSFPPAYTVDENGNKLHSWRTLILPFIEQDALYKQIDLTKPWDDPVNSVYSTYNILPYQSPAVVQPPGGASYVAVVDPSGIFSGPQGTKISEIVDGTSNTLLLAEVDASMAVNWMSPNDISLQQFLNVNSTPHVGGSNMALSDGSVQFLSVAAAPGVRNSLITKAGAD